MTCFNKSKAIEPACWLAIGNWGSRKQLTVDRLNRCMD